MSHQEPNAAYEASIRAFFHRQYLEKEVPLPAGTTLAGQVAVVTGANAGLGFEACRQLLALNMSHLVVAVRSQAKGDEAAKKLRAEFPAATVSVFLVDMESYDSVRAFVDRVRAELPRLDIALLNAGMQNTTFKTSAGTGHEQTFQINYLSTALLATLLVPVLKAKRGGDDKSRAGRPPVLSIVSSDTTYWNSIDTTKASVAAQFTTPETFGFHYYSNSKQCLNWYVAELARRVDPGEVLVNLVNPGLCRGTQLTRGMNESILGRIVFTGMNQAIKLIARTPQAGASAYVNAVVAQGKESHGKFVSDWTIKPFPTVMYTEQGQKSQAILWEETLKELEFAGVREIVGSRRV